MKGWPRKEMTSKTEKELTEREGNQGTMTQWEPVPHARQELEVHMVRRWEYQLDPGWQNSRMSSNQTCGAWESRDKCPLSSKLHFFAHMSARIKCSLFILNFYVFTNGKTSWEDSCLIISPHPWNFNRVTTWLLKQWQHHLTCHCGWRNVLGFHC